MFTDCRIGVDSTGSLIAVVGNNGERPTQAYTGLLSPGVALGNVYRHPARRKSKM